VALSRIIYGDDDWHYGKSLVMLAKAYHEHGGEAKTCKMCVWPNAGLL